MITHYDLFAGIGGFSLALEEVFDEPIKHVFCEWEQFPTAVLKKHWPKGVFYGDIADLVADTKCKGRQGCGSKDEGRCRQLGREISHQEQGISIVTGGFPCQPFSAAGKRRGTSDDRYKWPEMFEVIRNVEPDWVIAENVRGLVTWSDGMVLQQVCTDLEAQGYEVQPLIIPAVAVNAPHRRDRVWIIANRNNTRGRAPRCNIPPQNRQEDIKERDNTQHRASRQGGVIANTRPQRWQTRGSQSVRSKGIQPEQSHYQYPDWERNWQEVAFATCHDGVDDGLPRDVGGVSYTRAKWRKEALKAYGNAIVPQVAMQIFSAIKEAEYAYNN